MNTFEQSKKRSLTKTDKSNIGSWDAKIKPLCKEINKTKNYYTTSSCSGRIVLIKSTKKKVENVFIFRTHNKTKPKELKETIDKEKENQDVDFQQTPCILHVACLTIEDAFELINKAKLAGWKRSGIISSSKRKIVVELQSTESISFPIVRNKKQIIDDNFLKITIKEANEKLERCWDKIERLKRSI